MYICMRMFAILYGDMFCRCALTTASNQHASVKYLYVGLESFCRVNLSVSEQKTHSQHAEFVCILRRVRTFTLVIWRLA